MVIGVVKAFNDAITPGFSNRNKNGLNAIEKAYSYDQTKGSRIAVTSTETQLIVELQEVRHSNSLPASHQTGSDLPVVFGSLRFNVNPMAE